MNGWDASLRVPLPVVGNWLGVKGDVSGAYRNDSPVFDPHVYFFLAGPQLSLHFGKSTLFAHGLVGSAHLNQNVIPSLKSGSTFAMAAGGGLDLGISRRLVWRLTGDFYNTNFQSSDETSRASSTQRPHLHRARPALLTAKNPQTAAKPLGHNFRFNLNRIMTRPASGSRSSRRAGRAGLALFLLFLLAAPLLSSRSSRPSLIVPASIH